MGIYFSNHVKRETLRDYYEEIDMVKKCHRIPIELLNIIISYIEHPYYDIARQIKNSTRLLHDWDLFTYYNTGTRIVGRERQYSEHEGGFVIERQSSVVWNIKYTIPKALFVKGNYTMEVYFRNKLCMTGKCIIEYSDNSVMLWSLDTSLPIPVVATAYDLGIVKIIEETRGAHITGTLTCEHIYISYDISRRIAQNPSVTIYDMRCQNGLTYSVPFGTYNSLQVPEIFPGIKPIDRYE